jgi:serine/threonine protein kinase
VQASELPPGTVLGAYRIERRLGEGGMGVVYLAEHVKLARMVALKVLGSELTGDQEFRSRFERESKLAASLDHPNIVPVHDAGEAEGFLYIAMRLIEGKDLGTVLEEQGPLEPARALSVLTQTADALDEAHAAGLVHRDVKPGNIMLAPSRRGPGEHVYLTDFGLARAAAGTRLTRSGYFLGTIHYSSPEQITGAGVDGRADVYSLGCVAFECLTGRVPFERDHEPAVMYAHLREDPPRVTDRRPELPDAIDRVVSTAMAKVSDARFATCGQMVEAMGGALGGQAVLPTSAGAPEGPTAASAGAGPTVQRGAVPAGSPSGAPTQTVTPPQPVPVLRRRSRWPWIAGTLVVAGGLAAGGWLLATSQREPETAGARDSSPPADPTSAPPTSPPPPSPEAADVAGGRFDGQTQQGRELTFSVNGSVIRKLHIIVNQSNCTGTNGFPLVSQEFETDDAGGAIDPDGRFSIRLGGADATQLFEGRFTDRRSAEGTVSVRTTGGVVRPCTTGKIPWTAALRG